MSSLYNVTIQFVNLNKWRQCSVCFLFDWWTCRCHWLGEKKLAVIMWVSINDDEPATKGHDSSTSQISLSPLVFTFPLSHFHNSLFWFLITFLTSNIFHFPHFLLSWLSSLLVSLPSLLTFTSHLPHAHFARPSHLFQRMVSEVDPQAEK